MEFGEVLIWISNCCVSKEFKNGNPHIGEATEKCIRLSLAEPIERHRSIFIL